MSINFDKLPDSCGNDYPLLPEGWQEVEITGAEMKTAKSGASYLNLRLKGKGANMFDILMDSDKPALQFKLKKFIQAVKLPLHGEFELSDLTKVIVGKHVMACVQIQHSAGYPDRNGINIFNDGGYKPIENVQYGMVDNTDDLPFDVNGSESY